MSQSSSNNDYKISHLLLLGLLFHLTFINSVFDCYFTSPVVHGMRPFHLPGEPLAKRLVLIVGDGLRADLLFQKNGFPDALFKDGKEERPEVVAPYLRRTAEERGAFGVSHTRVPTESRPGHVSIIAGMYEDVSAVTKGWKTNPVNFDSVFNQSSSTFSFGSPDILPMFARGAVPGRVHAYCYNEEDEDFTKDATALDIWVLDQLRTLLRNATTDPLLDAKLRANGVVFFLHLLGLDTTGHSYRPHSLEYMRNIQVVDNIVRDAEALLAEFYGDDGKDTAYIFTADHGMSVIGNHGDGHPDNTRTPLIAWGSGIRGPFPAGLLLGTNVHPPSHDSYSHPAWGDELTRLHRQDIDQADLAPLMATLLGINWPVNSVGVLPDAYVDFGAGDSGQRRRAEAGLVNAQMITESFRVQSELKSQHTLFFKPFRPSLTFPGTLKEIESLIHGPYRDYAAALKLSACVIQHALAGLRYLQTYDRFLIRGVATAAYTGWIAYASTYILRPSGLGAASGTARGRKVKNAIDALAGSVLLGFWAVFAVQRSPWTYAMYVLFPCYFWREALVRYVPYVLSNRMPMPGRWTVLWAIGVVVALQGMVIGYTDRRIWSLGFVLIGLSTFRRGGGKKKEMDLGSYMLLWPASCLVCAVFPVLSVDKEESGLIIIMGSVVMLVFAELFAQIVVYGGMQEEARKRFSGWAYIQEALVVLSMFITSSSAQSLRAKQGLPLVNQVAGWTVLVFASLLPFSPLYNRPNQTAEAKLHTFFLGFAPAFVILSIREEGLFYTAFSAMLWCWVEVETRLRVSRPGRTNGNGAGFKHRPRLEADDVRIALFFLFFVQVGFFGTGNVASISSFYLAPVYRLIPIFSPFFMAALLIFKIIVPYIILSVSFATLNHRLNLPPYSLFLVALTLMDGMTLTFFFLVRDTGSWLEIGQTISFFCITSLLLVWAAGICAAGEYLMKGCFLVGLEETKGDEFIGSKGNGTKIE